MYSAIIGMKEISQRVKDKNFKELKNKPLFAWIIDSLLVIDRVDEIVINIQGDKLLDKVKMYYPYTHKIKVLKRDKNLEGHETPMTAIIESSLEYANHDSILNTHTTNPFLSVHTINKLLDIYEEKKQPLFSVNKFQSRFFDKNFKPMNHDINKLIQTQDLEEIYEENSCMYIFDKAKFLELKTRIFENSIGYPLSKFESIDIDTLDDWELASLVAKGL